MGGGKKNFSRHEVNALVRNAGAQADLLARLDVMSNEAAQAQTRLLKTYEVLGQIVSPVRCLVEKVEEFEADDVSTLEALSQEEVLVLFEAVRKTLDAVLLTRKVEFEVEEPHDGSEGSPGEDPGDDDAEARSEPVPSEPDPDSGSGGPGPGEAPPGS